MAKFRVIGQARQRIGIEAGFGFYKGVPVGRPRAEIINTKTNRLFKDAKTARGVKSHYEAFWNDLNPNSTEVVEVLKVERVKSK